MFIIKLTYKSNSEKIDTLVVDHLNYLDKFYQTENIICSGKQNPPIGGVIIADFKSVEEVNQFIKNDPFFINQIADYEIIEFNTSRPFNIKNL